MSTPADFGDKFDTSGGWISCNYNLKDFAMNSRRSKDLNAAIAKAERWLPNDVDDVIYICGLFDNKNTVDSALRRYERLDTIVRDCFPQWVAELAGCNINPRFWSYEKSLWGTEVSS